ncbi:hypothetical protein [Limosilactobacillus reuteri]|uniref:Uncharacterized protein n=1 Tax=Limosilactobacillus reuteri TaxID=1598 RepID=A0A6A8D8S0_LIMRT|nr:hypothetical protein [Limosilactobacillus reuteri]MRG68685.1 hypothetical protein [Limosilactobacillus reuteri]MRG68735.1 hypothetical protein [Limosilactobacillus reuteri]WLR79292.1 hypothetical protein Q3A95_08925 [Limosilactobacillus reuteri]
MSSLLAILIVVFFILFIYYWRKKNKAKKWIFLLLTILVSVLFTQTSYYKEQAQKDKENERIASSKKAESKKIESSKIAELKKNSISNQKAKKSSIKKDESIKNNSSNKTTSKKNKGINKALAKRLKEDQSFADQGNDEFAYAKYAYKVTADKNNNVNIYVTGDFLQLSNSQKNNVGSKLQTMANSVLYEEGKINDDEYREKPITEFFLNNKVSLGTSQIFDHSKFHWNKNN